MKFKQFLIVSAFFITLASCQGRTQEELDMNEIVQKKEVATDRVIAENTATDKEP